MEALDSIARGVRTVVRPGQRLVVVHSSLGALGHMADPPGTVLAAIESALPRGCTLAIPTFTFSYCRTGLFDPKRTPSEVGSLGEAFRRLPGVTRTPHPIYSFAVRGPLLSRILRCPGPTCWGKGSFFEFMETLDADILMLGCSWEYCTLFHRAEELAEVPYRHPKRFGKTVMYVRTEGLPAENRFEPFAAELRRRRLIKTAPAGKALVEAAGAKAMVELTRAVLARDPLAVTADPAALRAALSAPRVALFGSANLDVFSGYFRAEAARWFPGSRVMVPPFNQYRQELMKADGALADFKPDWAVFLERAEDVLGPLLQAAPSRGWKAAVAARVAHYAAAVRLARDRTRARILVAGLDVPAHSPLGLADGGAPRGHEALVRHADLLLRKALRKLPDVRVFDYARLRADFGRARSQDWRYWHMGRVPFSRDFSIHLGRRLTGAMLSWAGRTARALVLDLDNTLWGGIVGEDGVEGLQLGGDFPGNAYRDFQLALKGLRARGVALALCSKNTEATALKALRGHPGMALGIGDFAARRINWKDKATNVAELAAELSLGLESLCFIDDDPHERALVRRRLPQVTVPEWPKDPSEFVPFLLDLPCLATLDLTSEDAGRAGKFEARRKVEDARARFGSPEDFYRHLKMTLFVEAYGPASAARTLQLLAKTNQFNATTRRYGAAELEALRKTGASIRPIGLKDAFGERETIGLLILRWPRKPGGAAEIDTFLLSCRVLGRSVESAVLGWAAQEALRRGVHRLGGLIVPTPRNQPVRHVYGQHGFSALGGGRWALDLAAKPLKAPDWFSVSEAP